jgi:hypothetical protein
MIRVFRNGWKQNVGIIITIQNGSRFENEKTEGFVHAAEHFMFSGTKRMNRSSLRDALDASTHDLEATTAREAVHLFCYVDADDLVDTMRILHDMIFDWKCRHDVFADEKADLLQEMKSFFKTTEHKTRRAMDALLPYGDHEILGRIPRMKKITYRDVATIKRFWNTFLQKSPIDILLVGNGVSKKQVTMIRRLFGANVAEHPKPTTWKLKRASIKESKKGSLLDIQCNTRHPYLLLLNKLFEQRWESAAQHINCDWAQFRDRTVFFISRHRGIDAQKFFLRPLSKSEFNNAKQSLVTELRQAIDGVDAITSLKWLQGFQFRSYGNLPSEDPNAILRMYERLTYGAFMKFIRPILAKAK